MPSSVYTVAMNPALQAVFAVALFAGMVACLEVGFWAGRRQAHKPGVDVREGIAAIEAAVFALLGLLLGFSFAGGMSRLDVRRELIVQEANAIGTAYLRLELLTPDQQQEMHQIFREYVDARLRFYEKLPVESEAVVELARGTQLQQQIWSHAIVDARSDSTQNVARLLLPAVNEMIDVTTARSVALRTHLPALILWLLVVIALLSGMLAGYAMGTRQHRSTMHMLLYAAVVALTVYAVLDLDSPRSGFVRLTAADQALGELRQSMR